MAQRDQKPDEEPTPPPASHDPGEKESGDVMADLESYQKQLESDWETAKSSYQAKIDQIMNEFIENKISGLDKDFSVLMPSKSEKNEKKDRIKNILDKAEKAVHEADEKTKLLSYSKTEKPSIVNIDWGSPFEKRKRNWPRALTIVLLIALLGVGLYYYLLVPSISPLPYHHVGAILVQNEQIIIVDWFRKTLYTHLLRRGLPLKSVESLPNEFLTGLVQIRGHFWSLDGFKSQVLLHDDSSEHLVTKQIPTLGNQATGCYFDGTDLWVMEKNLKILYRFHGADLTDKKEEYRSDFVGGTGLSIHAGRVWTLDKKGRLLLEFRLEDPLRLMQTYDLDPILNGGTPGAFAFDGHTLWIGTEKPAQLLKTSFSKLKSIPKLQS